MCGRYVVTNPVNKTKKIVKTSIKVENDMNYNAHPSQNVGFPQGLLAFFEIQSFLMI